MAAGAVDVARVCASVTALLRRATDDDLMRWSARTIRRAVETELGLDEGTLDARELKEAVTACIRQVLATQQNEAVPSPAPVPAPAPAPVRAPVPTPTKSPSAQRPAPSSANDDDDDDDDPSSSDDDRGRRKSGKSTPTPRSRQGSGKAADKATRLKTYIHRCGIRKVWGKELAGLNAGQQVQRLETILRDAGMVGRPTLDKCKAIKAQRELAQEMADIDPTRIVEGKRARRSVAVYINMEQGSDSDNENTVPLSTAHTNSGPAAASPTVALKRLVRRTVDSDSD